MQTDVEVDTHQIVVSGQTVVKAAHTRRPTDWLHFENHTSEKKHTHTCTHIYPQRPLANVLLYDSHTHLQEINTTNTEIELSKLEPGSIYRILVVARSASGTSLPSSMLFINTSTTGLYYIYIYTSFIWWISKPHRRMYTDIFEYL